VSILDGAVVLATVALPATNGGQAISLSTPIRGSVNTTTSIQQSAAGIVQWFLSGYTAV
jgi:hypothetical protein